MVGRMTVLRLTALIGAVLLFPSEGAAQVHMGLGLGYSTPSGDAYQGLDTGIAHGGHLALSISDNWRVGVSFGYSSLGTDPDQEGEQTNVIATYAPSLDPHSAPCLRKLSSSTWTASC